MIERVSILQPILDAAVKARATQSWPTFDGAMLDRRQFVTASEIGKCARQVWFAKNLPPVEGMWGNWGFMERGHSHEAWIVEQLHAYEHGYSWTYIGKDQVSFHDGAQSGTPDGLLHMDNKLIVVDFKSIDPRAKKSALPKKEHVDQVIQNSDLVSVCLDLDIDGALIAYSDASDYSKVTEFYIDANSPQFGEKAGYLEDRAKMIMSATSAEDVPAEGIYAGTCTHCPFKAECSGAVEQKKMEQENHDKARRASSKLFG